MKICGKHCKYHMIKGKKLGPLLTFQMSRRIPSSFPGRDKSCIRAHKFRENRDLDFHVVIFQGEKNGLSKTRWKNCGRHVKARKKLDQKTIFQMSMGFAL